MERKLASIQTVKGLQPIEGADFIELAQIEGWQCVVKKGEFQVGDLGVYFEIDSIVPEADWSEFLRVRGFKIKTLKLRNNISQGLLMPLSILPEPQYNVGDDVTELLGVTKWEPPADNGATRGSFPSFISKTDETRVQSCPAVLDELHGLPYVITVKVDGQSSTFYIDPYTDEFHACSRNLSIKDSLDNRFWRVARKYNFETILRENTSFAIQGEVYGEGVQGNKLKIKGIDFAGFNVYNIKEGRHIPSQEASAFFAKYNIPVVPELERGESFDYDLEQILAKAEGKYANGGEREGIVIRSWNDLYSPSLNSRLSFKVISNKFLLKTGE